MKLLHSLKVILTIAIINVLLILFSGCSDTKIDPFEERSEIFSIYGALDIANTSNVIRVKQTNTFLLQDSADIKPFEVVFTDLGNNVSYQLEPDIINFNGNYTFNYPVDYTIEPDQQYQITMTNSEGRQSTAIARTPSITVPSVDTLGINNFGPLSQGNTECTTEHNFVFPNVEEGEQIYMFSGVRYEGRTIWARTGTVDEPTRKADTDTLTALLSVRQLLLDHFPLNDERFININPRFWPATVDCDELDSNEIKIRYFHFSTDWDMIEGDDITTDFLFQSGVVQNGIGFLGGMNSSEFSYQFSDPDVFPVD